MDGNAMTDRSQDHVSPEPALAQEAARFNALLADTPDLNKAVGHHDLASGLWLSTEPGSSAAFSCGPIEAGFHLSLEGGDSSAWATLGCEIRPEALRQGRYLGLLTAGHAHGFVSFRPALRWFWPEGGFQDVFSGEFALLPDGSFEKLVHIPIDAEAANRCERAELNLFFQGDRFSADFRAMEPLLIV